MGKLVREVNFKKLLRGQRSVITVKNNDEMCFARCLVVGMALANGVAYRHDKTRWRITTCIKGSYQRQEVMQLHDAAGVPPGPVSVDKISQFQNILSEYQIFVHGGPSPEMVLSSGANQKRKRNTFFCMKIIST